MDNDDLTTIAMTPSSGLAALSHVLNNEYLLSIILSHVRDNDDDDLEENSNNDGFTVKPLRLVHPLWNNIILSSNPPRLRLKLPFPFQSILYKEEVGGSHFPLEDISGLDHRIARAVIFSEDEFSESHISLHDMTTATSLYLTSIILPYNTSIQCLTLTIVEFTTMESFVFLFSRSLPSLRELDMELIIDSHDLPGRGIEYVSHSSYPRPREGQLLPKKKLEVLKFAFPHGGDYRHTPELKAILLSMLQGILDTAPNLTNLFLGTNSPPRLEKQRGLKSLMWDIDIFSDHKNRHPPGTQAPYMEILDLLQDSVDTLETLVLRFEHLDGTKCDKCRQLIQGNLMPPLTLPNLKKLVIQNANVFMVEGSLGFNQFCTKYLPNLEALEFQGDHWRDNSSYLQARLGEFLNQPEDSFISIKSLHLGTIRPGNEENLSLTLSRFPHLSLLQFTLIDPPRDAEADNLVNINRHTSFLVAVLNNASAIPTLKELRIEIVFNIQLIVVVKALMTTKAFSSNALRKFRLAFSQRVGSNIRDYTDPSEHPKMVAELVQALVRTKRMERVELNAFTIPPTVLIPVLEVIKRLELPVSFGTTVSSDWALGQISSSSDDDEDASDEDEDASDEDEDD